MRTRDGGTGLLSYDEALTAVLTAAGGPLAAEMVPLADARGRVLAAEVIAQENLPSFANSAVDGYVIYAGDGLDLLRQGVSYQFRVGTEARAGAPPPPKPLSASTITPIYTGAPVPDDAAAIVMVEDSERQGGGDVLLRDAGTLAHIRRAGSDLSKGSLALPKGTVIDAGVIGLLAALNTRAVSCARPPRVGIVTTGDEVFPLGDDSLSPGQIRNANGPSLRAAVEEAGGVVAVERHARDTIADVRRALEECVGCDLIVSCGGVSMGRHDYVKEVVEEMGTLDFWSVAIRPGKPLAFGRLSGENTLFFGLPGNPVSSLVTFELFVRPVLRAWGGYESVARRMVSTLLTEPLPHTAGRREFVRARLHWENNTFYATVTGPQGSHRLHSLVGADAYLVAHEDHGDYAPGARLPALWLS